MVCTGNSGRSPVAELIARDHLKKIGADSEYGVISSGTLVAAIAKGGFPIKIMTSFIDQAKDRGDVYDAEQLKALEKALEEENREVVEGFYNQAVGTFVDEEHADRAVVVPEFGYDLNGLKKGTNQTIVRPDVIAVLAMDKGNREKIMKIYKEANAISHVLGPAGNSDGYQCANVALVSGEFPVAGDFPITIGTLSGFVTGDPDSEIPNAFGRGTDVYRQTIAAIADYVPRAIDRLARKLD